jgi:pimeloyl-ACP methyl ester carboxylesterase/acyl carrier protein
MGPSAFVTLSTFPLTPNGKVDRKVLPAPERDRQESSRQVVGAQTETEIMLVDMWRELLDVEGISVYDNFFDLGGHSLQTFQVSTRIEEKTGFKPEPMSLRMQSLKQLAASIDLATGRVQAQSNGHVAAEQTVSADMPVSNEQPYFFRSGNDSLYGVYYQAQTHSDLKRGVVICSPWGQEYIRTHRALHQLAVRLSDAGIPVLKFDYYGTGDSHGEDSDFAINRSVEDVATAIDQLRQRSGVDDVVLVGLRLGGTLAALAQAKYGSAAHLALWDPIVNGNIYLDELAAWHKRNLQMYLGTVDQRPDLQTHEVLGFAMSDTMREQLNGVNLLTLGWPASKRTLLVEREANENTAQLQSLLQTQHIPLHYQQIDGPQMWTENTDKGLVPHQTLEAIVSWIKEI